MDWFLFYFIFIFIFIFVSFVILFRKNNS